MTDALTISLMKPSINIDSCSVLIGIAIKMRRRKRNYRESRIRLYFKLAIDGLELDWI